MNADFGSGFNSYRVKNRVGLGEERTKSVKNRERKAVLLFSVSVVNEEEEWVDIEWNMCFNRRYARID